MQFKSFSQFLTETPPPPDWDIEIFNKSFKKRLAYAIERAKKLGTGSSRVVFEIEYQGRPTVIKIAKNEKGLAQNEKEADWSIYRWYPDITVPLIDVDQEHDQPTWIQLEKAEKLTKPYFKAKEGFSFDHFARMLWDAEANRKSKNPPSPNERGVPENVQALILESEIYSDFCGLLGDFDLLAGDMTRLVNWGVYNGNPVAIDLGFDSTVWDLYFKKDR